MITLLKIEADPHSLGWFVTISSRNETPVRIRLNWQEGEIVQAALRKGRNEARRAVKQALEIEREA